VIHKRRREYWFFCLPCPAQPSPATWHPSGWDLVPKAKSPRERVPGRIGHQLPILLSTPSLDSHSYLALTLPGEGFSGRIDDWGPILKYIIINLTSVGGGKEKGGGRVGGVHEQRSCDYSLSTSKVLYGHTLETLSSSMRLQRHTTTSPQ
jgi:hypothetical protein